MAVCSMKQFQSWSHNSFITNDKILAKKVLPARFGNTDEREKRKKYKSYKNGCCKVFCLMRKRDKMQNL